MRPLRNDALLATRNYLIRNENKRSERLSDADRRSFRYSAEFSSNELNGCTNGCGR